MQNISNVIIHNAPANASRGAVEVTFKTRSHGERWCFFMTPEGLARVGDFLPGTTVRVHYGAPHMIVVSAISEEIIVQALEYIDSCGEIETSSKPT